MASSVIGALRVNLGLDSAQFARGLSSSRGSLTRFAAWAGKTAAGLASSMSGAMQAMGISAINQAAEIENLSRLANAQPRVFQEWAAGAKSVGIEQDKLSDILKDTNDKVGEFISTGGGELKDFFDTIAPKVGVTAEQFRALSGPEALQLYVDSLQKAGLNQAQMTFYMEAIADEATALLPLLRDGGAGMDEYARKAQAVGAVMDDEMLASLGRGKAALSEMSLAVRGMRNTIGAQAVPVIEMLSTAVMAAAQFFRAHAAEISAALRTLAGTAAVVAVLFAGKYVVSIASAVVAMASAAVQSVALEMALGAQSVSAAVAGAATKALALNTKALSAAMIFLRGTLIATGIGALVVAAGYLVGKFLELVSAAGGFGEAMALVTELASQAWDRISAYTGSYLARVEAGWKDVQAGARDAFASVIEGAIWFANRYIGIWRGSFGAIEAIWSALPGAIGSVAYQAANALISAVQWMLNQAAKPIDVFIRGLNNIRERLGAEPIELIGEVRLPELSNPYDGKIADAGRAAAEAFKSGFNSETIGIPTGITDGLRASADALREQAGAYREASGMLAESAARPLTAWEKIKSLLTGTKQTVDAITPSAAGMGQALGDAGEEGAKGLKKTKEAADRGRDSLRDFFGSWLEGVDAAKKALADLLMQMAKVQFAQGMLGLVGGTSWGKWIVGAVGSGLGANANGTSNWRGGLTQINERGGEIVDLPSGTRIIPHDVSNRMVDRAAAGGALAVTIGFDSSTGGFSAYVRDQAGQVVASGISAYDKALPSRVQKISQNPRKR